MRRGAFYAGFLGTFKEWSCSIDEQSWSPSCLRRKPSTPSLSSKPIIERSKVCSPSSGRPRTPAVSATLPVKYAWNFGCMRRLRKMSSIPDAAEGVDEDLMNEAYVEH